MPGPKAMRLLKILKAGSIPGAGTTFSQDGSWISPTPGSHLASHQNGGSDEISVVGLSGLLADSQTPLPHTHSTVDINNDAIDNTKLANMVTKTYKGRTTAATGDPEDVAVATLKADLILVKADVGLGNVDNTSDAAKPVSTATQTALDAKQASDADLTALAGLAGVQGDIIYRDATTWQRLPKGTANQRLSMNAGASAPEWQTVAAGGLNTLRTTADQTINAGAGTFTDITGLTFPVVSGVDYAFHFYITFQSAAAATGWAAGVDCPAGTLDFWAQSDIIANGAAGVATHTERHNTVRNDMTLLTATVTAAVDLAVRIEGRYKCTANGTFAARFANELAANTQLVVQKGSWGYWF